MGKRHYNRGADRTNRASRDRALKGSTFGPAGPVRHIFKRHITLDQRVRDLESCDIWITTGPLVDGCLQVHNFASHADAAKAGFPWAGKETASQCTQRRVPSPHEIAAAATPAGGWTAAQLAEWGVPWPPPRGWRGKLEVQWLQSRKMPVR